MNEKVTGFLVHVLRTADGDFTKGGVSSVYSTLTVTGRLRDVDGSRYRHELEQASGLSEEVLKYKPAVWLYHSFEYNSYHWCLIPAMESGWDDPRELHRHVGRWKFGGNFATGAGAITGKVTVKIHDREER